MLSVGSVVAPLHGAGAVEDTVPADVRLRDPDFYKSPSLPAHPITNDGCMCSF